MHQVSGAVEMIEYLHSLGYETSCNIMAISQIGQDQIRQALEMISESSVDVIYLVDSFGSLYPENACELSKLYLEIAEKTGKSVGFHAHNNQNLAFANTIETLSYGVSYLDASVMGMGRGAGNCQMELLLGFLKNPKYNLYHLLGFMEHCMLPLKQNEILWGYDVPYLFTGLLNQHPREAIQFMAENKVSYADFYKKLLEND